MHERALPRGFLFGIDKDNNINARFDLQINDDKYEKGFVFVKHKKYSSFEITKYVNYNVFVYDMKKYKKIHTFSSFETKDKVLICEKENSLYRFGKYKYIQNALLKGEFLIKPALDFTKEEHNEARKDNEHVHAKIIKKENAKVETLNGQELKLESDIEQNTIDMNIKQYILCVSYEYDKKLYNKFDSDACLVIHNPKEFEKRLMYQVEKLYPDFLGVSNRITYSEKEHVLGILFIKPYSFHEQKEYRFCWRDDKNPKLLNLKCFLDDKIEMALNPIKIRIGNLEDIASLVVKENCDKPPL